MDQTHSGMLDFGEGPDLPPLPVPTGQLFKRKTPENPNGILHVFDGRKWVRVEDAVEALARQIFQLCPTDRLRVLECMREHFCSHCGYDQPENHACYCSRDPERD